MSNNIFVESILVSSGIDNPKEYRGVQVKELSTLDEESKSAVILAIGDSMEKRKIQKDLYDKGFKQIIPIF